MGCAFSFAQTKPQAAAENGRKAADPILSLRTDEFWLNLHQFLYVLGRASNKERDAEREAVAGAPADQEQGLRALTPKEQAVWHEAVAFYASGMSGQDIIFDDSLVAVLARLRALVMTRRVSSPGSGGPDQAADTSHRAPAKIPSRSSTSKM